MPDDAPQPQPDFYHSTSQYFAKFTHLIDSNIRIVQYGVYCVGTVGLVLILHSARAFTKFAHIQDIPKEFITKHVKLHGQVKWVGVTPPTSTPTPTLALPHPAPIPSPFTSTPNPTPSDQSATLRSTSRKSNALAKENVSIAGSSTAKSLSEDNRGIYEGAGELHPWENNIDPDIVRIDYEEDLQPLYIKVEHTPVIPLLQRKKSDKLLPLQLADIEVNKDGLQAAHSSLMGQRVWFNLISHDLDHDVLNVYIRPVKLLRRRTTNEELVRGGLALAAPMDLSLHADRFYASCYGRIHLAQDRAERQQLGMWKGPEHTHGGYLTRLWGKLCRMLRRS
ncbi:hypothetical protein Pmani_035034 [Petrolisthes manimaculis]|uniref:TNase-like domain-containing protein n=1 Tax=Petrolisthes manimaculis TaxID=1843537 RepID=A0AAE1NN63_9EUCA|nr:hypothetical protein Pmani_035034 [Petrolisthes manimaculis]